MIRKNNMDYETDSLKNSVQVTIPAGLSATESMIFIAPYHCKVTAIKFSPQEAITASLSLSLFKSTATSSLLVNNITQTMAKAETITITPSGNNSLTAGTTLSVSVATTATGGFDGAIVNVIYTPLRHGEDS